MQLTEKVVESCLTLTSCASRCRHTSWRETTRLNSCVWVEGNTRDTNLGALNMDSNQIPCGSQSVASTLDHRSTVLIYFHTLRNTLFAFSFIEFIKAAFCGRFEPGCSQKWNSERTKERSWCRSNLYRISASDMYNQQVINATLV